MENQRNMILAVVLSAVILIGWTFAAERFFPTPKPAPHTEQAKVATPTEAASAIRDRKVVLGESPRIAIDTPALKGSIALRGARIDDLVLTAYRETIKKSAPPVRLLSPGGTADAYFASYGWTGEGTMLPGPGTLWTADANRLAPGKPVTLTWRNPAGQLFTLKIAIDEHYMFTIEQSVANQGKAPVAVRPYALVSRRGVSKDPSTWTMHTGPVGAFQGAANYSIDFADLDEAGAAGVRQSTTGGWLGFGDKYWQTALVPDQSKAVDTAFRAGSDTRYQAEIAYSPVILAPGRTMAVTQRFFAGAKEVKLLDDYEKTLGIVQFSKAIDWGWFEVFERPIFWILDELFRLVGNFGVAIILLTLLVRALMFPIAQKQFRSMAGMRRVQPKMKALQEKHKDDRAKLQQEMLALYQSEKINPLSGCLPIFLQIPIFYALYKVLMLSIEMRHQPFVLWIKDLSAPDPLTPINLFGLLPFDPPSFLHLGILPILLGITMYLQFKLNPQPMDETQKQVFAIMPWVLMFVMAPFAAGLQLYWVVSNVLTILQQKWLYSRDPLLKEAEAK